MIHEPVEGLFLPSQGDADGKLFAEARKRFLYPSHVAYCDTGTLGASPREVVETILQEMERVERELADDPRGQAGTPPTTIADVTTNARAEVAALLGTTADEVALVPNATTGMGFVANGLDLAAGDEIVTTDQEHSGGIGAWRARAKRHGIVVRELPVLTAVERGLDEVVKLFADSLTPKTRVVMFSHVTSHLGVRMPVRDLCALARGHGALSVVDGAQAVGHIRVDVTELGCDAYVSSGHKWLLGPKGTGILFVRRDVQDRVWSTITDAGFPDRSAGASRFMRYGTANVPALAGLRAALGFISKIGIERIERWNTMLSQRLRKGLVRIDRARLLSPPNAAFAAGITAFTVGRLTPTQLRDKLWERKVRAGIPDAASGVRISAHLYVSPDEIDRILDLSESLARA